MNQPQQPKKRVNPFMRGDNILETVRGMGSHIGKTVANDVVSKIASNALSDIVGARPKIKQQYGEIAPHEHLQFEPETHMQPRSHAHELIQAISSKDITETKQKLDAVRSELQALSKSIQGLQQEIQTAVMEMPVDPGIYHLTFFEQLKQILMSIRERVDDSRTWLATWKANAKKKQGYWGLYKKHGTSFGLSSERTLSTQAG